MDIENINRTIVKNALMKVFTDAGLQDNIKLNLEDQCVKNDLWINVSVSSEIDFRKCEFNIYFCNKVDDKIKLELDYGYMITPITIESVYAIGLKAMCVIRDNSEYITKEFNKMI